jgi:hypothetical protein
VAPHGYRLCVDCGSQVYDVLYDGIIFSQRVEMCILKTLIPGKGVDTAVQELMSAPPSRELELPKKAGGGPAKQLMIKLGLQ